MLCMLVVFIGIGVLSNERLVSWFVSVEKQKKHVRVGCFPRWSLIGWNSHGCAEYCVWMMNVMETML